jgi:uncharacterized protein YdeI (YjbR/CyaY-like superfamily)
VKPIFFESQAALRRWLEENHDTASELWVGLYKVGSGKPSITWPEVVDEALCFGWIDGIRKSIDDQRYTNRLTPRKPGSYWSARNVLRAKELIEAGRMTPAGLAALESRREDRTAIYSYEQRPQDLPTEYEREVRANRRAWDFWRSVAPSYRKAATWWVISAKQEDTRRRRLAALIEHSARGERVPPLRPPPSMSSRRRPR